MPHLSKYKFLIEESKTQIFQRIINSFSNVLTKLGHEVKLINLDLFESNYDYINYIQQQNIDYCIISNSRSRLSIYSEELNCFLFELCNKKVIFIHHDNIFSGINSLQKIRIKIEAFQRIKDTSYHFCAEYFNFLDLRDLGIENAYHMLNTSEYSYVKANKVYSYNVSFVGHLLPGTEDMFDGIPCSHLVKADFWNRLVHPARKLEPSAISFANRVCSKESNKIDWLAAKYFYTSMLHSKSQFFRGELIKSIDNLNLNIFGGDPGYINEYSSNKTIQKPGIKYHSPTSDYSEAKYIYANSKINLNITSLQFDNAVIHRVIDVASVGGFVLTDWKADLRKITSVHEQISYRTIEELSDKIKYYLSHEQERIEIAEQLHQDVINICTYDRLISFIISKINVMSTTQSDPLRVDLGCGTWKPEGFVGVDISDRPGIDVVADLTQRFPFPDNSVSEVRAYDIIEHLSDRIHTMNEIWRICQHGAIVDIRVPSTDGRGAFQDPTHVSFWNINSFRYYCIEFPAYLELCRSYGFKGAFSIVSLEHEESPDQVVHVRAILKAVKTGDAGLLDDAINGLKLKQINLVVFPDWCQPEEDLAVAIGDLIRAIATHPDKSCIALLIDTTNIADDDAELILSSVAMNLLMEEDLDVADGPEISLAGNIDQRRWEALVPYVQGRILMELENQQAITSLSFANAKLTAEALHTYTLENFSQKRVVQLDLSTWILR